MPHCATHFARTWPNNPGAERWTPHTRGDYLCCPACREASWTHFDRVRIGACDENQPITMIQVNAITGNLTRTQTTHETGVSSRRHRIEIGGYCEICGWSGWLQVAQHKGVTILSTVRDPFLNPYPDEWEVYPYQWEGDMDGYDPDLDLPVEPYPEEEWEAPEDVFAALDPDELV